MKRYVVCIFDLYGTLIDIHTDERKASFWKKQQELFSSYGADYRAQELRDAYFETVRHLEEERHEEGHRIEIDISDAFEMLLESKGVTADERIITEIAASFRKDSTSHIRLYAGAKELFETIRKLDIRIFLLSNAQELFTLKEMKDLGIYDLFDDVFISSACGYKKPDPAFMKCLLEKHGLNAQDCLMIGNDLYDDVQIADVLGMDSYYIEDALSSDRRCAVKATYMQKGMNLKLLKRRILSSYQEKDR